MAKYAVIGGYTAQAWSAMIDNPAMRGEAVRKLAESVGAKLDQIFWTFGEDDFLVLVDAPDDLTAGAVSVAAGSSGSLRNVRTVKLITQEESRTLLDKAKKARAAYIPPGAREAVGVR